MVKYVYNAVRIYLAHNIVNEMFFIDWENQNMSEIDCQYRGLHEIVFDFLRTIFLANLG